MQKKFYPTSTSSLCSHINGNGSKFIRSRICTNYIFERELQNTEKKKLKDNLIN